MTLACSAGALMLVAGETFIAAQRPDIARHLPGNQVGAARLSVPLSANRHSAGIRHIAQAAISRSSLAQSAVTALALAEQGNADRRSALSSAARKLGYRDPFAQQQLYNLALQQGDCPTAMVHLQAMLLQGDNRSLLSQMLVRASSHQNCARAIAQALAADLPWSEPWIASYGAFLPDRVLLDYIRAMTPNALGPESRTSLIRNLLQASRFKMANTIWQLGSNGNMTSELTWPTPIAAAKNVPFEWEMGAGLAVEESATPMLALNGPSRSTDAVILLGLEPGSYVMNNSAVQEVLKGWEWSIRCADRNEWSARRTLTAAQRVVVNADCPAIWLRISPSPILVEQPAPLPPLRIAREASGRQST